jgi:hypothetical protein
MEKELRIGNITKQGIVKNFWEKGVHVGFGKCYEFNELEPTPITEEYLLSFGFQSKDIHDNYKFKDIEISTTYRKISNNERYGFHLVGQYEIKIEFVHQLQNLYFVLTNEELTFKQ